LNVRTNGKLERWHKSLKSECIRSGTPLTREDALRLIQTYVEDYNTVRLRSDIGYVTPLDMLAGRQAEIHAARDPEVGSSSAATASPSAASALSAYQIARRLKSCYLLLYARPCCVACVARSNPDVSCS
jgi:hypothetical protein